MTDVLMYPCKWISVHPIWRLTAVKVSDWIAQLSFLVIATRRLSAGPEEDPVYRWTHNRMLEFWSFHRLHTLIQAFIFALWPPALEPLRRPRPASMSLHTGKKWYYFLLNILEEAHLLLFFLFFLFCFVLKICFMLLVRRFSLFKSMIWKEMVLSPHHISCEAFECAVYRIN